MLFWNAFMLHQRVDVCFAAVLQIDFVKQIGELLLQVGVYEIVWLYGQGIEIEKGNNGRWQIVAQEIAGNVKAGECLFEEFIMGTDEFGHRGEYNRQTAVFHLNSLTNSPMPNPANACRICPIETEQNIGMMGRCLTH